MPGRGVPSRVGGVGHPACRRGYRPRRSPVAASVSDVMHPGRSTPGMPGATSIIEARRGEGRALRWLANVTADTRWMTYQEMADHLGMKVESARRRAQREGWPRLPGNDGKTRVGVPGDATTEGDRFKRFGDLLRKGKKSWEAFGAAFPEATRPSSAPPSRPNRGIAPGGPRTRRRRLQPDRRRPFQPSRSGVHLRPAGDRSSKLKAASVSLASPTCGNARFASPNRVSRRQT